MLLSLALHLVQASALSSVALASLVSKPTSRPSKPKLQPPRHQLLQRLWRNSQTKLLAYSQGLGAAFLAILSNASTFFNDPHFKEVLSNFEAPKWIYIALAVLALLTWLAHGRADNGVNSENLLV